MRGWKQAPLGELVRLYGGGTPTRSNSKFYGGEIPWVTPKDMKSWELHDAQVRITRAGLESSAARLVQRDSVLVVVRSGVLKHSLPVAVNRVPVAINQDMKALVAEDEVEADFLARYLQAQASMILQWVRATTADNLPVEKLKDLLVPLPPLPEQQRITKILDHADALRAKRRAALAELDALTQAIFLEMFGDPVGNPKGWPMESLGAVAEVQGGLQVTTARNSHPIRVPYLRVANVYRGKLDLAEIKCLRVTEAELLRTRLRKDDLLVVEGHGNPEEIGRAALWDGSVEECVHQNHLIRARLDSTKVLPLFASFHLNSPAGRRHLLRSGKTTSGLNTISVSDVRSVTVPTPPLSLQQTFARKVEATGKLAAAHRHSLTHLDALFASLQHRAFRGEL